MKKVNALIEDRYNEDARTGVRSLSLYITIYADKGLKDFISSLEGIMWVSQSSTNNEYMAKLDPRYDRKELIASIIQALSD